MRFLTCFCCLMDTELTPGHTRRCAGQWCGRGSPSAVWVSLLAVVAPLPPLNAAASSPSTCWRRRVPAPRPAMTSAIVGQCGHGLTGSGASGRCTGQSVRGVASVRTSSMFPAQLSRVVRNAVSPNRFFTVAWIKQPPPPTQSDSQGGQSAVLNQARR